MSRNFREYIAKNLAARIAAQNKELQELREFARKNRCFVCHNNYGGNMDECMTCGSAACTDCREDVGEPVHPMRKYNYIPIDGGYIKIDSAKCIAGYYDYLGEQCSECSHKCEDFSCSIIYCTVCITYLCKCGKICQLDTNKKYHKVSEMICDECFI
jgi:hypothetical protein